MKTFFKIFFVVSLLFLVGCGKPATKSSSNKPTVMVSIPPYSYIVKRIAGETVQVQTIVPVGSNPHIFEPKPSNLNDLHNLKLIVLIGEGFENKIKKILNRKFPSLEQIDLSTDATIESSEICTHDHDHEHHHHHHDESMDLHFWLNPKIMSKQAEKITFSLCKLFPENEELYKQNLAFLLSDLESTDNAIEHLLAPKKDLSILVSHPAFAYFCEAYHIHQLSIEVDGKEPLPRDISRLLEAVKKASISYVLTQPQHSNKGAEAIAKELGLGLIEVDPYKEDYLDNLMNIASILSKDPS